MSSSTPTRLDRPLLLSSAIAATGQAFLRHGKDWSYQLSVAGTGAVAATATVEVSNNDGADWLTFGTLSASGTTRASDLITGVAAWGMHRAKIDTISGTGAVATVTGAGA